MPKKKGMYSSAMVLFSLKDEIRSLSLPPVRSINTVDYHMLISTGDNVK